MYGYLMRGAVDGSFMIQEENKRCHIVDNNTIGEYMGLTDKNGKKIFEDDILKIITVDTKQERYVKVCIGEFTDCNIDELYIGVYLKFDGWEYSGGQLKDRNAEFEIIGNIYDNPELLEAENG